MESKSIYGHKKGYHTPNTTTEVFYYLEQNCPKHTFSDSSWGNDVTDSIIVNNLCLEHSGLEFKIFIPNSLVDDESNERYSYFTISYTNDVMYDDGSSNLCFKTLPEVIEYLNSLSHLPKVKFAKPELKRVLELLDEADTEVVPYDNILRENIKVLIKELDLREIRTMAERTFK